MIFFLSPKGNTNTWGIVLIDTLWNVVEEINDTCMRASVIFHGVFHRFRTGRGMGMTILEIKFSQDMASFNQDPLLLVFLDLCKANETLD